MCPSVLSAAVCLSMLWMFNLHRTWLWYRDAALHSFWKPLKTIWSWKYIDDVEFFANGLGKELKIKKNWTNWNFEGIELTLQKNGSNSFYRILQSPRDDLPVCGQQHASRIGCIDAFCNRIFVSNYKMQMLQIENDAKCIFLISLAAHTRRPHRNK